MTERQIKQNSLLSEISTLYYEKGMTQEEIAEKVFLTRTCVSRLLKKARECGVVEVRVRNYYERNYALEDMMIHKYHLQSARIYNNNGRDRLQSKYGVCALAATYLQEQINEPITLGVSWGSTIAKVVDLLQVEKHIPINAVQIMGFASLENPNNNSNEIVSKVANKWGGTAHYLNTPLYVADPYVKEQIINDPVVSKVLNMALNSDLVITSIGTTDSVSVSNPWLGYMNSEMLNEIINEGAVGCIGAHFFNKDGDALDSKWNRQCIGINLDDIKMMKYVVGIVSGKDKANSVKAALKGGIINILITDSEIAQEIIYA